MDQAAVSPIGPRRSADDAQLECTGRETLDSLLNSPSQTVGNTATKQPSVERCQYLALPNVHGKRSGEFVLQLSMESTN
jgi:hypothetical protein